VRKRRKAKPKQTRRKVKPKKTASNETMVSIPALKGDVRIRGLTRQQLKAFYLQCASGDDLDIVKLERLIVMAGMVKPSLTEADYDRLCDKPAGIHHAILHAILQASEPVG
jgi:hypothetical protein